MRHARRAHKAVSTFVVKSQFSNVYMCLEVARRSEDIHSIIVKSALQTSTESSSVPEGFPDLTVIYAKRKT